VVIRGVLVTVIVSAVYLIAMPHIAKVINVDQRYLVCFLVMALYLFVRPLNVIVMNYLRVLGEIALFNTVNIFTKFGGIVLGFALLLWAIGELYGYLLGMALAEVGATVFLYRWFFANYRLSLSAVSGPLTLDLFKFGVPLLLTELSYLLLSYSDRYLIVAFRGEDVLGLYSVGYSLPSYINELIMFSLSYAVVPIYTGLFSSEGRAATERFLSRAFRYYIIGIVPICVGYAAVARDLIVVLASEKYADASTFSPIILVGLVCLGMNSILYAGLYLNKKSVHILGVMLAATAANILLNVVLLPRFGAVGAATATLAACAASSILTGALSSRYLRIDFPMLTLAFYGAVATLMYLVLANIEMHRAWLNIVVKVPIGFCIVAVAVLFRETEVRKVAANAILRRR